MDQCLDFRPRDFNVHGGFPPDLSTVADTGPHVTKCQVTTFVSPVCLPRERRAPVQPGVPPRWNPGTGQIIETPETTIRWIKVGPRRPTVLTQGGSVTPIWDACPRNFSIINSGFRSNRTPRNREGDTTSISQGPRATNGKCLKFYVTIKSDHE